MLMIGCVLATFGVLTLVFAFPSKEARRRRQSSVDVLENLRQTGGTSAVVMGSRLAGVRALTARHPWVYFALSPLAALAGIALIVASG